MMSITTAPNEGQMTVPFGKWAQRCTSLCIQQSWPWLLALLFTLLRTAVLVLLDYGVLFCAMSRVIMILSNYILGITTLYVSP